MGASPGDQMRKLKLTDPLMTGDDVKAAQRVLHDNRVGINFHPGKVDGEYGPKTAAATGLAKFLLGYPDAEVNQEFGPNVYGFLVQKGAPGYQKRPDTFLAPSAARRKDFESQSGVRGRLVKWCLWGVANSAKIAYAEERPMPIHAAPGTLPITLDCSASTTVFANWAHAPDPNGLGYTGAGNTMEMLAHLRRIKANELQPGDLIVYDGDPQVQHVVVVMEADDDPVVESHGSAEGPHKLNLSDVTSAHPGQDLVYLALM